MKNIGCLNAMLLLLIASGFVRAQNNALPEITLSKLDGEKVNIADFGKNGQITVINFWATWCTPCKKELNNMVDLYEDWKTDYNVEIVAISIDDARNMPKVKAYVDGQSWEYTVLLDPNQDLKRALNFQTIPYTVLVDENGNIVYRHNGYVEGDEFLLEDEIKTISE